MTNILAIIQARMGSTRLPNKMTLNICGKTILEHVIERVKSCKEINKIVVATSEKERDDIIEKITVKEGLEFYRGNEENVLKRFEEASDNFKGDIIIRICADSPLVDPEIIDQAIIKFLEIKPDYLTTTIKRTFPEGLDIEIFSKKILDKIYELAEEKEDLEHVTLFIKKHQYLFNCYNFESSEEFNHSELKLTLDTQEDYLFIKSIFEFLYTKNKLFNIKDILTFLKNRYKIIIRCDGSNKLGLGDIVSMLNLAANIKYYDILFLSKFEEGINKIKESGYNVEKIPEDISLEEEISIIKKINERFKSKIIITELFRKDYQEYYKELSQITKTMVVDLFGNIEIYSDILLNWNLLVNNPEYIKKNKNTIYCLGPEYALLKEKIEKYHNSNKMIKDKVENVLITMGGADPRNLTTKILNALRNFKDIRFSIVIGSAFENKHEIKQILEKNNLNYNLIENINDLSEIMYGSDLVLCAGGLTSFELSAMGIPFIGISNIEWESDRLKEMDNLGICKYAGNWNEFNEENLQNIFKGLIIDKELRTNMRDNGKKLLDGKGVFKIANIIKRVIQNGNKTNN